MTQSIKWCCAAFRSHFESAGQEGFGLIVERWQAGQTKFSLRHQAISPQAEVSLPPDLKLTFIDEVAIKFCPWCSKKLERFYRKHIRELTRENLSLESLVEQFQK